MSDEKIYHIMPPSLYAQMLQQRGFARPEGQAWRDAGIQRAGRFFGRSARTAQGWVVNGPSSEAAMLLYLMDALDLDAEKVEAIVDKQARKLARKRS